VRCSVATAAARRTLLRIAAGLLRADQGVILFDGVALPHPRLHQLARRGLFLLSERGLLLREPTVGALLRIVAEAFGTQATTASVVERLRAGDLLEQLPGTLSGGEQRRVEVAVAIVRAPRVLLADEPFMGIAPADADVIAAALRQLAADGCAVIVSGHEVEQVLDIADEVIWITAGTTHGLGPTDEARRHWQFQREYLGALHRRVAGGPAALT
jgi:ABC-type multidrug transport system ATPase subunit